MGQPPPTLKAHRAKLILSAHWGWGPGHNGDLDGAQRCLDHVLDRAGNDYADLAIVATIYTEDQWEHWGIRAAERLTQYKEQGRIGAIGMSSHFASTARKAVEGGLIDVLMYGVNLVHHDNAETERLLQACAERNVGVVAMKPY